MTKIHLKHEYSDELIEVGLDRLPNDEGLLAWFEDIRAEVGVVPTGAGSVILRYHGRTLPACFAREDDTIHLWIAGRTFRFEVHDRRPRRGSFAAGRGSIGDLTAPMPGTVLEIRKSVGECFDAHDALIVLESMKMEMTLSAPSPGRVVDVLCQAGELVDMGATLMKLDGDTSDAQLS